MAQHTLDFEGETMQHVHPWADMGLGKAPFRFVSIISLPSKSVLEANPSAYNNGLRECYHQAQAFGLTGLGCCHACGMGLKNNFVIRDADGKHFIVGCDCAAKTGDSKLVTNVEAANRKRQQELRRAKQAAKIAAEHANREAELKAQRDRNGGLTDSELEEEQRKQERAAKRAQFTADNQWLIDGLSYAAPTSGFTQDMIKNLERGPWSRQEFSPRMIAIICDIYGKGHGRRNSKAYNAARDECEGRLQD